MAAKTLLTLEQFMALPEDGNKYELNRGELVTMPPAARIHVMVIWRISKILSRFVDEHRLGRVYTEAGYMLSREPESTYRQPDISFLSRAREQQMGDTQFLEGAPDLAIEVISPGNTAEELAIKIAQYLAAGGKEVWAVYPTIREVLIHKADGTIQKRSAADTVTSDLFPNWSAKVSGFFQPED
jgi:Uma2 family endonuclease